MEYDFVVMNATSAFRETRSMQKNKINRRQFVKQSTILGATCGIVSSDIAMATVDSSKFKYEVTRSDEEWKSLFDEETYKILRKGDTEWPKSSKWWNDYREGIFACVGCGLQNYDSVWRVEIDKGWVFFSQSVPDAILMGIDGVPPDGMSDDKQTATIEAHCRRCGSHMGHILKVDGSVVHCINGKALSFTQK